MYMYAAVHLVASHRIASHSIAARHSHKKKKIKHINIITIIPFHYLVVVAADLYRVSYTYRHCRQVAFWFFACTIAIERARIDGVDDNDIGGDTLNKGISKTFNMIRAREPFSTFTFRPLHLKMMK